MVISPSQFYSEYMRASATMGIPPGALDFQTRFLPPPEQQDMPIVLVANSHKETRPYAKPNSRAETTINCFLDAELKRISRGDGIEMFAGQFSPYRVLPNRYPFGPTHILLTHDGHSRKPASVPTLEELTTLDRFSAEASCPVWRNVLGTNASAPYHDHAHAMKDYVVFPVSQMQIISDGRGVGHLIDFPGQHAVFYGKHRAKGAYRLMQRLQGVAHPSEEMREYGLFPFATLFAADRIFVAPVRTPQISQPHRIGAGELFGYHAAPIREIIERTVGYTKWNRLGRDSRRAAVAETLGQITYDNVRSRIAQVLFPTNDPNFNLYRLLRR